MLSTSIIRNWTSLYSIAQRPERHTTKRSQYHCNISFMIIAFLSFAFIVVVIIYHDNRCSCTVVLVVACIIRNITENARNTKPMLCPLRQRAHLMKCRTCAHRILAANTLVTSYSSRGARNAQREYAMALIFAVFSYSFQTSFA